MINDPLTADINTVLDDIMRRIGPISYPEDEPVLISPSQSLLERGWLPSEIVEYQKYCESVDKLIDEDVALARMQTIIDRVCKRAPTLNKTNMVV